MNETRVLVRTIAGKEIALMRRYLFNTVSDLVMMYVFFAAVFFGGRAVAPDLVSDSLVGIIVGFFLLTMASVAYSELSWNLIEEAQWGTLEQLYMSPMGFGQVVAVRSLVNLFVSFLFGAAILVLMMLTTGRFLEFDLVTVVPLVVLSLAPIVGIGFVLGGLALLYKRIENVFQIVQFALVGFIAAPIEPWVLKLLPLTLSSHLLRQAMGEGVRLWALPAADLALLIGKAVVYMAVGYLLFRRSAREARKRGVLGHY